MSRMMDVREAIATAKRWTADLRADEDPHRVGLEEVRTNDETRSITVGFPRPWDEPWAGPGALARERNLDRTCKVVTIDERTGGVPSSENRDARGCVRQSRFSAPTSSFS